MAQHNELGQQGEKVAIDYLRKKGYRILEHNWRYEKYEIDIIASNSEFIIFVEVKTRQTSYWGNPEEAVSKTKIRRIVEAADFYLKDRNIEKPARFDIIAIVWNKEKCDINHFDDAFLAPLN